MKKRVLPILFLLVFSIFLIAGCAQESAPAKTAPTEKITPAAPVKSTAPVVTAPEVKPVASVQLTSPAFQDNGNIPSRFTCQGDDINPELNIRGVSENTKTLVLILDDPDAPVGVWNHWVMWNLPVVTKIAEDSVPTGAVQGKNSWGKNEYGGPCPPSGTHRYIFRLYALDTTLSISKDSAKGAVEKAMQGSILAQAKLTGLYSKS